MRLILYAIGLAALALPCSGCGETQRTTVSGIVKLDGKVVQLGPSQRGTVLLQPVAGGATATGFIQPDGSYEVLTGGALGLEPGQYQVSVRLFEVITSLDPDKEPTGRTLTPAIYNDPATSGLECLIVSGQNRCDLSLQSDVAFSDAASNSGSDGHSESSAERKQEDEEESPESIRSPADTFAGGETAE